MAEKEKEKKGTPKTSFQWQEENNKKERNSLNVFSMAGRDY